MSHNNLKRNLNGCGNCNKNLSNTTVNAYKCYSCFIRGLQQKYLDMRMNRTNPPSTSNDRTNTTSNNNSRTNSVARPRSPTNPLANPRTRINHGPIYNGRISFGLNRNSRTIFGMNHSSRTSPWLNRMRRTHLFMNRSRRINIESDQSGRTSPEVDRSDRIFKCTQCECAFKTQSVLNLHMNKRHQPVDPEQAKLLRRVKMLSKRFSMAEIELYLRSQGTPLEQGVAIKKFVMRNASGEEDQLITVKCLRKHFHGNDCIVNLHDPRNVRVFQCSSCEKDFVKVAPADTAASSDKKGA